MLTANKPLMKQKFANMLTDKTGMFYKAAYNALLESMEDQKPYTGDDAAIAATINAANAVMDKLKIQKADAFASAFVKSLKDSGFDDLLADEIDKHVKSLSLMITMLPQGLATLISPMGPCTGTMVISDATANIQVL